MGLDNREGGNYITIFEGKFSQRVKEGTIGAVSRVNKKNNLVWEKYYDSFTGKLVNIRTQDSPYGKNWLFDFRDGKEVYHLQLSYSNSFAKNILKMLPNIDLTKEMKVQPSQKVEGDKTKTSLFISQDGVTLKHAYTKDVPNGLPQMVQVTVKGQAQWDDTDQLVFLNAMVERDILPKLPKDVTAPANEALAVEAGATGETPSDDDDF